MLKYFPNVVGVAEDVMRLFYRVEYCFGGKKTSLPRESLELQLKFLNKPRDAAQAYRGGKLTAFGSAPMLPAAEKPMIAWRAYLKRPYRNHADYEA